MNKTNTNVNRRDLFIKCARGMCIGILAYVTGLLTFRYFRSGGRTCRSFNKCASCRNMDNCSLIPSLPRPRWKIAEKNSKENS